LPVFLRIEKPVIGQPLLSGSLHFIVIADDVVLTFCGAGMWEGFRHAKMVVTSLFRDNPFIFSDLTLNL
jgi:hypothetical protein